MATLGSVYHDFPLLAKQSGFYFQLHSGRVNWSEIENLNVDEIVEKRNFQLLEQNLINVINCNLEREYDLKCLDQKFVKLFKLAQLGLDYLSYCEMYLDRCVVLLQEQLSAFQEERELFKQESQKKKEEISKSKRKNKTSNYQCEKCEKVFISDVYLKFHDKRRHSNPNTPKSLSTSLKKFIDNCAQTEDERILSSPIQTLVTNKKEVSQECMGGSTLGMEQSIKIEKLEQELKELKEHFKKTEKTEVAQLNLSNALYPFNNASPNSTVMFLPSYLSQLTNNHTEINAECPILFPIPVPTVPEIHKLGGDVPFQNHSDAPENKSLLENITPCSFRSEQQMVCETEKVENKCGVENIKNIQDSSNTEKKILECNKENVNPNIKKNMTGPLPPPRKLKKGLQLQSFNKKATEAFPVPKNVIYKQEETADFNNQSVVYRSPVKDKLCQKTELEILGESKENLEKFKSEVNSAEGSQNKNSMLVDDESKSMFKKIVARNSTTLQKLSKNIKRSLTNMYESVSSNEKSAKKIESGEPSLRTAMVNELNVRLREFGVDPEWKGIPKKTMKKKLKVLKHRRKLFSKGNPLYPTIRQSIEENIFEHLKKNLRKKPTLNKLNKERPTNIEDVTTQDISPKEKSSFVKVKNCAMYNYKSDPESEASDFESNFTQEPEQKTFQKPISLEELSSSEDLEKKVDISRKKEFNLSVFQVVGESLSSLDEDTHQKQVSIHKEDEVFTDSDSFLEESDNTIFKGLKDYLKGNSNTENLYGTLQRNFTSFKSERENQHLDF